MLLSPYKAFLDRMGLCKQYENLCNESSVFLGEEHYHICPILKEALLKQEIGPRQISWAVLIFPHFQTAPFSTSCEYTKTVNTAHAFCPRLFYEQALKANDIHFAFGVPDSSLSGLLSYFSDAKTAPEHIVTANEGAAIALAAGYHLATHKVALAYMQNSGFSNALNPLQSLASKEVYGVPMLLIIGWRGKPGTKDEPQHALIGPRLLENLSANDIPYEEVPSTIAEAKEVIDRLLKRAVNDSTPVALIVPSKTFLPYKAAGQKAKLDKSPTKAHLQRLVSASPERRLSRELAIHCVIKEMRKGDVSVSSLGGNSREFWMLRKERGESIAHNFFCIGAMGHTYALACGIAIGFSSGRLFCIDGDGSFLMHSGNNAVLAGLAHQNVIHVVIHNGMHSSTGNQPLMIKESDLLALAEGLPYKHKFFVDNAEGLRSACRAATTSASRGTLIIAAVNDSVRKDLPRPTETPHG